MSPLQAAPRAEAQILSGRYFWQTGLGAILVGARWDESIPTYPLLLEASRLPHRLHIQGLVSGFCHYYNAPYGGGRTAYESAGTRFNDFSEEVTARPDGRIDCRCKAGTAG